MKMVHGFLVLLDLMVTTHEIVQVCVVAPSRANAATISISAVIDELPAEATLSP